MCEPNRSRLGATQQRVGCVNPTGVGCVNPTGVGCVNPTGVGCVNPTGVGWVQPNRGRLCATQQRVVQPNRG
ncbi:hypothetical protein ARTHRO_10232 [Limnospira indica PCC 8005]|uniref:Uncharacterized protein n=1 Tax=Limnospira indica PCC 8005 TaxID=376219 RepID=A0A9P1KAU2_9CYAN|nr:hypothetical protein ARTHRO_10232 [Limnospira indica PCC 8005]